MLSVTCHELGWQVSFPCPVCPDHKPNADFPPYLASLHSTKLNTHLFNVCKSCIKDSGC